MKWSIGFVALSTLASTGCSVIGARPAFTCPAKGGARWTEVTSEHFVVSSDLDRDDAQKAAASLETMFHSLSDLGFASESKPETRIDIVYFRRDDEYHEVAPPMSAGVFIHGGRHDFERTPLAMLYGDLVRERRATLQHELAHHFTHFYYPQAPTWFNEGLSVYYETLDINDGVATLGRVSDQQSFWKGPWKYERSPDHGHTFIPLSEAPAATALVKMGHAEFYGNRSVERGTDEGRKESELQTIHYAAAGALVHLLLTDPTYADAFPAFLERMHDGESGDAAWEATVGQLDLAQLDAAFRASLAARDVQVLRTKYAPPPTGELATRALPDIDVHLLWARIRDWSQPKGKAAAEADLAEVRAREPGDPGLALLTASLSVHDGNASAGETALVEALRVRPDDPRLLNALGWLRLNALTHRGGPVRFADAAASLAPVAEKLAPVATTAAELDLLARSSAASSAEAALAYEKRALAVDPSCYLCLSFAADVLGAKGLVHDALATATLASGLLPDGARAPKIESQMATYRRRLTGAAAAARVKAAAAPQTRPAAPATTPPPPSAPTSTR